MSLENLQTLSKLKKNMRAQLFLAFFGPAARICFLKKICTHIFLSLERVWRFSKLILFSFFCNKENPKIIDRVWREYGESPNSLQSPLQTRSKLICFQKFIFIFSFCVFWGGEKGSELGDSPNSLQTGSKPICVQSVFLYCFWNRSVFGVTWRLSKLS